MDEQRPRNDDGHARGPESTPAGVDAAGDDHRIGGLRQLGVNRRRWDLGRGVATAAVVVAAAVGAGVLAVVGGTLTLIGWGLAVVVAILAIGTAAAIGPRPANGWLLVPVLALALASTAVALSGVRILPDRGRVVAAPASVSEIPAEGYRAGLGDLLVDLRGLEAEGRDEIVVRGGSDLGRTVVALPRERCFNLDVRWRTGDFRLPRVREHPTVAGFRPARTLTKLGALSPENRKRVGLIGGRIAIFGRAHRIAEGRWVASTAAPGAPTLRLELASEGGSFVVRDFPDHVSPLQSPDWPIDQRPIRRRQIDLLPEIRREERAVRAAQQRALRRGEIARDEMAVDIELAMAAERRVRGRLRRRTRDEAATFGREWARRVTGTCNPRGTFR